jgi:CRP-like cAMP-binding protein
MNSHFIANLLRKIDPIDVLSDGDKHALANLPMQIVQLRAGQDIVRQGDRPTRSCLLIDGFASASKVTGEGNRQIASLYISGDIPDLQSLHLRVMDITFTTMTTCRVGFIQHEPLAQMCAAFPALGAAMWRTTLVDAAVYREWVANVGQRQAHTRMAHLLCEVIVRLRTIGLAQDYACDLPMTQADIGDAIGVSVVHVNRILGRLRTEGLIIFKNKRLKVLDWPGLMATGDFDAAYLHLEG